MNSEYNMTGNRQSDYLLFKKLEKQPLFYVNEVFWMPTLVLR